MEVYNFDLRFSGNFQNGCISLSFLAACRITLSPFSQTRSERHISQVPPSQFNRDSSIGTCPTKSSFLFPKFMNFEINAPLN